MAKAKNNETGGYDEVKGTYSQKSSSNYQSSTPAAKPRDTSNDWKAASQAEIDQAKQNATEYYTRIQGAQVKPEELTNQWEKYKTAQTAATTDYTKNMEKYIAPNIEQQKFLSQQYTSRMDPQFGMISAAQANLAKAAEGAQAAYGAEATSVKDFFNNYTKNAYEAAMAKANQQYDETRADVKNRMNSTDTYYENSIKPQYAKLMEGGLSLREASDPTNSVTQGVQGAYEKLIQKSQEDADKLSNQVKSRGQADYGILAALGNQARGGTAQGPMTGAQMQLSQAQGANQASAAYQQAMQRVGSIEDQQRLYAQGARTSGLESGMDQSWKNYNAYGQATKDAQGANLNNYNAMLSGDASLANITNMQAASSYAGIGGIANARSQVSGDVQSAIGGGMNAASQGASGIGNLASQFGNLAGQYISTKSGLADDIYSKQMMVPGFNYNYQSGLNQGDYQTGIQAAQQRYANESGLAGIQMAGNAEQLQMGRSDRMRAEDIALQQKAIEQQVSAARAAQEAANSSSMWGSVLGTVGTVAGGVIGAYGGPVGSMAGAAIGGGLGRAAGGAIGGGGAGGQSFVSPQQGQYIGNYVQNGSSAQAGVYPAAQQGQYGLGINQGLYRAPYSAYTGY